MAITFPLASPSAFGVAAVTWGVLTNVSRGKAPWTLRDLVQVFDGAMWTGQLSIVPQDEADGRRLAAWLVSLQGSRGTFLLGDPAAPEPLGSAGDTPGAPVVSGAGQTGDALAIKGLPEGVSGWLRAGDYFQLGSAATARLYMALEDVDSDSIGEATMKIWPALRSSPSNGSAVVVSNPHGVFALASSLNSWQVSPGLIYDGVVLDVAEVVP